jgi:hypothetical protein
VARLAALHERALADQAGEGAREVGDALVLGGPEEITRQVALEAAAVLGAGDQGAGGEDIDAVMAAQAELVEVVHTLKQVMCIKG